MRIVLIFFTTLTFIFSNFLVYAQANSSYEVEVLVSKKKDTKEVDSVIDFQEDKFTINSDKKGKYSREFTYSELKRVQYSYTKNPIFDENTPKWAKSIIGVFAFSAIMRKPRTHWLTIVTEKDFVILKLERDNHKQICLEFEVHKVTVEKVAENSSYNEN